MPKPAEFPTIKLKLIGVDGNAFAILGAVRQALRRARAQGVFTPQQEKEYRDQFMKEAMAGDYDYLLRTAMEWFDVT